MSDLARAIDAIPPWPPDPAAYYNYEFGYDGLGRRVWTQENSGNGSWFIYDGDQLVQERDFRSDALIVEYAWGPTTGAPAIFYQRRLLSGTPQERWIYTSPQGGFPRHLFDDTGTITDTFQYSSFGELVFHEGTTQVDFGCNASFRVSLLPGQELSLMPDERLLISSLSVFANPSAKNRLDFRKSANPLLSPSAMKNAPFKPPIAKYQIGEGGVGTMPAAKPGPELWPDEGYWGQQVDDIFYKGSKGLLAGFQFAALVGTLPFITPPEVPPSKAICCYLLGGTIGFRYHVQGHGPIWCNGLYHGGIPLQTCCDCAVTVLYYSEPGFFCSHDVSYGLGEEMPIEAFYACKPAWGAKSHLNDRPDPAGPISGGGSRSGWITVYGGARCLGGPFFKGPDSTFFALPCIPRWPKMKICDYGEDVIIGDEPENCYAVREVNPPREP